MFKKLGYNIIDSNVSLVKLYIKNEDRQKLVIVFDCSEGELTLTQCNNIEEQVVSACKKDYDNLCVFNLFICDKISKYIDFNVNERCFIDIEKGDIKLFLDDDSMWQEEVDLCKSNSDYIKEYESTIKNDKKKKKVDFIKNNIKMSVVWIVFINVIVFFIMDYILYILKNEGLYDTIVNNFGCSPNGVIKEKQVYRILTATFLHGGINHLVGNMVSLLVVGYFLEETIGHLRFLIIYLFTGIIADFVSIGYNVYQGKFSSISIGASGAIFGVIGIMCALLLIDKKMLGKFGFTRFAIYILYSLYIGFSSYNVDNAAHVGGVIAGFIIGVVMFYFVPKLKNN